MAFAQYAEHSLKLECYESALLMSMIIVIKSKNIRFVWG